MAENNVLRGKAELRKTCDTILNIALQDIKQKKKMQYI